MDHYETTILVLALLSTLSDDWFKTNEEQKKRAVVRRNRRPVLSIMAELGSYVRRYYRMDDHAFWGLHTLLSDRIDVVAKEFYEEYLQRQRPRKKRRGGRLHYAVPDTKLVL